METTQLASDRILPTYARGQDGRSREPEPHLHRARLPLADVQGAAGCAPQTTLGILVADHHEVFRIGLKSILEARKGWHVVAEAANGKDAIAQAAKTRPDIAIVDSSLPLINGVEVARQIRARSPETEVLFFTAFESESLLNDALLAGARAILLKSDAKGNLLAAVESLGERKPFFVGKSSEQLLQIYLGAQTRRTEPGLSPRERTVVQLIAEGHSNKAMSEILNLSVKTIETHRAAAMRKLGIASTAGLVRYAIRNKLIEP
jgi:DNA-binding NarL/FixJ family response regulator